ncbi:[histone H3]-lysine(4) N-trimethyltransferase [Trifolium repens]|jgi:euchromatic histone-lysine N-methyltransferase|nr:[histone H3]-lysine(4) N-trimethyltransferase [Trifolium repens]
MDNADQVVQHVLDCYSYYRYVIGLGDYAALAAVRNELGHFTEPMIARSRTPGPIPGVHVGDQFSYRSQIFLVGMHDNLVRGISLGSTLFGLADRDVATCCVAVFELHNFFAPDDSAVTYGGEGGHLNLANQMNLRVLTHQQWTRGNRALWSCHLCDSEVRVIAQRLVMEGTREYVYIGRFQVVDMDVILYNNLQVYQYQLTRVDINALD